MSNEWLIASPEVATRAQQNTAAVALIMLLAERWPKCFSVYEGRRRPLKLGIHRDILAALDVTYEELSATLGRYCTNVVYLSRCREGAGRIDLSGEIVGWVTADEAKQCTGRMAGRAARRAAKVADGNGESKPATVLPEQVAATPVTCAWRLRHGGRGK